MRKRIAFALAVLLLAWICASGQAATYTYERDSEVYLTVENFTGSLPEIAWAVFSDLLREGDTALGGTVYREMNAHRDSAPRGEALLAVLREESVLLMSAHRTGEDTWCTAVESDSFLAPDEEFSIETVNYGSRVADAQLVIACKSGRYMVRTQENAALNILECGMDDGSSIICRPGYFSFYSEGMPWKDATGMLPVRVCAWSSGAFPKTPEEAQAFANAHPHVLGDDEGYISGVNLRECATDKSPTWGKYTAKVRILGSRPGRMASWVNVLVGNMTGWISGIYLVTASSEDREKIYDCAAEVHPVGMTLKETALMSKPDGTEISALAEGVFVHVLGEKDGLLHVVVPKGEISWQTDWAGTYGFVKKQDMQTGVSVADAVWRGDKVN